MKSTSFMKYLIIAILLSVFATVNALTVDTMYVRSGATVTLQIDWNADNYGTIQWQKSIDKGSSWTNISGATTPSYDCSPSEITLYRAKITSQAQCEPTYITKAMKIITFTSAITKLNSNSVEFSLTNVDFRGAKVIEWGFCYNISKLNTRVIHDVYKHKQTGSMPAEKDFKMVCDGLQPATAYYIRNYFKLEDGTVIYGPQKSATTASGIKWSAENWTLTKNTAVVRFDLVGYSGATTPEMTLKVGTSMGILNTVSVNSLGGFKYSSALLNSLTPNTSYVAQVEVKLNDSVHVFNKTFKTLSDYSSFTVDNTSSGIKHRIMWNTTLKQISPVGLKTEYPRVLRVNTNTLLCAYHGGANDFWVNIYLQKSYDNGVSWTKPTILLDKESSTFGQAYWRFTNPEMIKLKNGWIVMSVTANGNPETNNNCHVMVMVSKDGGETWGDPTIMGRGRTWEPMIVQLPNGELELYVSSEAQWWGLSGTVNQEILYARSTDNGETWTELKRASYSPDRRDGMPVGIVMKGNKGVLFSIEIVNDNGWGSPTFVKRALNEEWDATPWNNVNTAKRWDVPMNAYGGAPYTVQLPTGEIIITAHADGRSVWQTSYPRIVIADSNGKIFSTPTIPITNLPALQGLYYNSLFLKDANTIWLVMTNALYAADGTTRLKGEIKYIEGKIVNAF